MATSWDPAFSTAFGDAASTTLTVNIHINLTNWSGSFAYIVGNRIANGGNAYQCITAGTSGVTATGGPSGTTSNITDGTAHWKWLSAIDYSSLSTLQASLPATFTQPIVWNFWNDGTITVPTGNSFLIISGHTTSPTNNLTIMTAPGESFRTTIAAGHTALAFNTSSGVSFTAPTGVSGFTFAYLDITDSNVIVDGLQFQDPTPNSAVYLIRGNTGSTGLRLQNCIFDGTAQSGQEILAFNDTVTIVNSLLIDRQLVTSGNAAVVVNAASHIINCTVAAINAPSGGSFLLSNVTTAGINILRNTAAFGHGNLAVAAGSGNGIVIDHCLTSAANLGINATDNGNNLLSQPASSNVISGTTDFRLKLGSACINTGVTDTVDIPGAKDIAGITRPQGTSWDIGATELNLFAAAGSSISKGRLLPAGQSAPARGTSESLAKAVLTITKGLTGRGVSLVSGRSFGTFALVSAGNPWSSDFGDGTSNPNTDPFGPLSFSTPFVAQGVSKATSRATMVGTLPLFGKGFSNTRGKVQLAAATIITTRGISSSSGRASISAARPITGSGFTTAVGRSISSITTTLSGAGKSSIKGFSITARIAFLNTVGKAVAKSRAILATPALPVAFGKSTTQGKSAPVYTAPPLNGSGILLGKSRTSGRAIISPTVALNASGKASLQGFSTYGSSVLILSGSGQARAIGQSGALGQSAALNAKSQSSVKGAAALVVSQPVLARGAGKASGTAAATYPALLHTRALSTARGQFGAALLSTRSVAKGFSASSGKALMSVAALLRSVGKTSASSKASPKVALPLLARGISQISGQFGIGGALHLSTSRGIASAVGVAAIAVRTALNASGTNKLSGRSSLLPSMANVASGNSIATGSASATFVSNTKAIGKTTSAAAATINATVSLSANGTAKTSSRSRLTQQAILNSRGSATIQGQSSAPNAVAGLVSVGKSAGTGRIGLVNFAPIALTGSGFSNTRGVAKSSGVTGLHGAGVGLSTGRCATVATALMMASGRTHGIGQLGIAAAIGLIARGTTESRGTFFNRLSLSASGFGLIAGRSVFTTYYNVTPDTSGPGISAITQFPAFDSMDVGDLDFFSWDWSERTSQVLDPIISASVTASPQGLPVGTVVVVGDVVQARIGSAALIETFSLRCSVTLRSGRVLHWSAPVSVEDF